MRVIHRLIGDHALARVASVAGSSLIFATLMLLAPSAVLADTMGGAEAQSLGISDGGHLINISVDGKVLTVVGTGREQLPPDIADVTLGVASSLRRFVLAWVRADRGALDEARAVAAELREHGRAHRSPLDESRGRWALAEVLRRAGDLDGAQRELQVALGMVVPLEQPGVLATLSAVCLAQGRPAEALAAAEEASSLCAAMGGCGMSRGACVRLAHAEALHAIGAELAARRVILEARARLLQIASRIPDPDVRTGFFEGVPEHARTFALARAWLGETPAS